MREQRGIRPAALVISLCLMSSAAARIIYVDHAAQGRDNGASWADAFTSLSAALLGAGANDEIRVAQGTYKPGTTRDSAFELWPARGAKVRGGYAGPGVPDPHAPGLRVDPNTRNPGLYETILSGDIGKPGEPNDNCYHVVDGSNTDTGDASRMTELDGFTITGGSASGTQKLSQQNGGGMYNSKACLTIRNCHFHHNYGGPLGGAMFNTTSTLTLRDCRFSDNRATNDGGAVYNFDCQLAFIQCTFRDNHAGRGGGICNSNSAAELLACAFCGNSARADGGGMYNDASRPKLTNCLFRGNQALVFGGAISTDGNGPTLTNCTLAGNCADESGGGLYNQDAGPTLTNCILWGNCDRGGTDEDAQIYVYAGVPDVNYCCVQGWTGKWPGRNIAANPLLVDPEGATGTEEDDLHLLPSSPCIDTGCNAALPCDTFDLDDDKDVNEAVPYDYEGPGHPRIFPEVVDLGAFEFRASLPPGAVIHVNARASDSGDGRSWSTALNSLQLALQTAEQSGGPHPIWVAAGTYRPAAGKDAGSREASFRLISNVALYGGFAGWETRLEERDPNRNETILSGDLDANDVDVADPNQLLVAPTRSDNSHHVVMATGVDATAVLDGFTITGGRAASDGGGAYLRNSSPTIIRCVFRGNAARGKGGAIYGNSSTATIRACTIRDNCGGLGGGGIYCDGAAPLIQDNTIENNRGTDEGPGGGIACDNESAPVIEHNRILRNRTTKEGGAIWCFARSGPWIVRNVIEDNEGRDGGGIYSNHADPNILNNLIIRNTAEDDGGGICAINVPPLSEASADPVAILNSRPTIRNNTIARNRANPQGGGIYCDSCRATIMNCILWENGDDFQNWTADDCHPIYSCIQDGDAGVGNISFCPYFVDPDHDDYHLQPWSACIDAGPNMADATTQAMHRSREKDLEGNLRPKYMVVDMGAYETDVEKAGGGFDSEGDGLPDAWEIEHFGGLGAKPEEDPDGDGYTNLMEYQKGAKPKLAQTFLYVSSAAGSDPQADGSFEHPFASIQQAIDAANDGGHISVTEGTFYERLTIDGKSLFIDGGYSKDFTPNGGTTVLDAGGKGRGVVYINVPGGRFTGFTITGGRERDGGGMYLFCSSPTIRRCRITGNYATDDGGGVSFYYQCQGLFEDNLVAANSSGDNAGGIFCRGSSPTISRCTITDNEATGGTGGGIRLRGDSRPLITDCTISGNRTPVDEGAGILCRQTDEEEPVGPFFTLVNCTIRDNDANVVPNGGGGGLVLRKGTHAVIQGSTLSGNTAPELRARECTVRIEGIVNTLDTTWDMKDVNLVGAGQLHTGPGTVFMMDTCSLQGNLTGQGTIDVGPDRELYIDANAFVNFASDPGGRGVIHCDGLLYVRDNARIKGAEINVGNGLLYVQDNARMEGARVNVARASFEGDVNISNSVIYAEAGVPYGQFFVADDVNISDSEIHADGDRYLDLDPAVFSGSIRRNRIFVEISEGVGHTRGGLFELRGLDLYRAPNDPADQFLYPRQVPDFSTVTWTLEELKLAPGAKLNLTNRFDFQGQGGEDEVLYVRHLVLGPNSVLNTAFNRVYYETNDVDDSAVVKSVPLLGFSLNNIAFDSENEFLTRIRHNSMAAPGKPPPQRVQWVLNVEPDRKGMMRMCNLLDADEESPTFGKVIAARAQGLFAKSNESVIRIRFEYLFCDPAGAGELVVYLTDSPELLAHDDPNWPRHYLEVGRLLPPPADRPGAAGSNTWGVFEQMVPVGNLNFVRGTRVELELLGPVRTCVLINNWDPGISCTSPVCGDVTGGDDTLVNALDFYAVLSECGRRISEESDLDCLDGFFCADKYVTVEDALAVDWTTTERKSLCPETMLVDDPPAALDDLAAAAVPGPPGAGLERADMVAAAVTQNAAAAAALAGRFLVAAKRYESSGPDFLSDRLYGLDDSGDLVGAPFRLARDHCNGKLVRDPAGNLYQLNLELGLVRVADNEVVVAPGRFPFPREPRYEESAQVYLGLREQDYGFWSRPMLDAAFDADGYLYLVPVVVVPDVSKPYVAAARFRLSGSSQSPDGSIEQVFDDRPPDNDNMARSQLREVEVDGDGNVYVLNCHGRNRSDVLWVYDRDGQWLVRLELQKRGISAPVGLCVSACDRRLYLASAENSPDANSVKVHVLSTATWSLDPLPALEIHGMGHVTDITEDPATGMLCVVGFEMPAEAIPTDSEFQDSIILSRPPFYEPRLAFIPFGAEGPVEAIWPAQALAGNGMRLPLSVICTGGAPARPNEQP